MPPHLHIGQTVHALELDAAALAGTFDGPRGLPLADPVQELVAALERPLELPSLAQAMVPGDRVTIALDADLPCVAALAAGAVQALLSAGIEASNITLLASRGAAADETDPRAKLSPSIRGDLKFLVHDPEDRRALGYVAATEEDALPIYVQRAIYDADFTLPIGLARGEGSLGYAGPQAPLYPLFGDDESQRRFVNTGWIETAAEPIRRVREAAEANWLIGAPVEVLAVPGGPESLLHLVAGVAQSVGHVAQRLYSDAWSFAPPARADLVLAGISGGAGQQSWLNLARALAAAQQYVRDEGVIVLATDLAAPIGPALSVLAEGVDDDETLRELRKLHSPDLLAAALLLTVRQRANIYLLSQLGPELVEPLGLGHLADVEELSRLLARTDACLILNHAQYVQLAPADA